MGKGKWRVHFRLPTDVQAEAIPAILGGGDVLMVFPVSLIETLHLRRPRRAVARLARFVCPCCKSCGRRFAIGKRVEVANAVPVSPRHPLAPFGNLD